MFLLSNYHSYELLNYSKFLYLCKKNYVNII